MYFPNAVVDVSITSSHFIASSAGWCTVIRLGQDHHQQTWKIDKW